MLAPPAKRLAAARARKARHRARQRHYRQRQRAGLRMYRLELSDRVMEGVLDALVSYRRLSEADTLKRTAVERALVEIITDVGRRFVTFRDDIGDASRR